MKCLCFKCRELLIYRPCSLWSLAAENSKFFYRLFRQRRGLKEAGLELLQVTVGYKLSRNFNAKPLVLFMFVYFFKNIYLIYQLPTPCCGLGLVNKQCRAVSEVWTILSSGIGFVWGGPLYSTVICVLWSHVSAL